MIAFYRLKLLLYHMKVLVWCLWYVEGGRHSPCPRSLWSLPHFFSLYSNFSLSNY